jgi:REG-2-like HAD superfamily hydrolase
MKFPVRALSFDVTGTLLIHKYPIAQTYIETARWARLHYIPSEAELKPAFWNAYRNMCDRSPNFGTNEVHPMVERDWWRDMARMAMEMGGCKDIPDADFDRFFRRVYQHYGSLEGYETLADAVEFLEWVSPEARDAGEGDGDGTDRRDAYLLGITSNSPARTLETVVPMLGMHERFSWSICNADVGYEKPHPRIFEASYEQAKYWIPDLKREEILHIGDSLAADYCGARAAGFQALYLDRSENDRVDNTQAWLKGPDYDGKSEEDINTHTVKDFSEVKQKLLELRASVS